MKINFVTWILIVLGLGLGGCTDAQPVIKRLTNSTSPNTKVKPNTTSSLAVVSGTITSGTYKVKFSVGSNQGATNSSQVSVTSGSYKVRASSTGVLRQ